MLVFTAAATLDVSVGCCPSANRYPLIWQMSLFASTSSFLLSSATSARTLSTSTACRAAAQRDHYAVLGVRPTASPTEIKLAFRKLAKQHHPDVAGSDADTKFKAISEAYTTLSNDRSRRDYDNIHRPSGPGGMSSNMGSSYYSAARASPGATHAWQDYRKHHPRWKAAHGNYRNPFEQHRHQQQQQKTRSDTDDLFDRMYARSQRAGNLYGTQARMRREAAQKAAWEKSHGTNVSTTLRVSQFCAAMTVVWLFVSLTRVNAEMCDPDEEEQEDR